MSARAMAHLLFSCIRYLLNYFEKLVPLLSDRYQVIVLDLPGYGQSSISEVAYTEKYFRRATREFTTQLHLKDVTLVGGVLVLTV